jgi:hypothetical protein
MKNRIYIQSIIVCTCITTVAFAGGSTNTHEQIDQLLKYDGKKLVNYCMPVLNEQLAATPVGIFRVDLAYNATLQALQNFDKIEDKPEIVNAQVKRILAPVKQFFDVIKKWTFVIKPLIEESLLGQTQTTPSQIVIQPDPVIKDSKECLLLRFFEGKQDVGTFFDQTIKTKHDLVLISREFIYFFKDLKVSLSDETLTAYKKFLETLKPASSSK